MRKLKGFVLGVIFTLALTMTTEVFAESINVIFNSVNVKINGVKVASKGENYTLKNGKKVPFSITYKNTVYLPLEKMGNIFNMDITSTTTTISANSKKTVTTDCSVVNYKGDTFSLRIDKAYSDAKIAFIEDEKGVSSCANVSINDITVNVTGAYDILQGKTYILNILLKSGELRAYKFKTDPYIVIDLNSTRDYFVPANPAKGFNYPYYISFKAGNNLSAYKKTVMFDTNNNSVTDTNEQMYTSMFQTIKRGSEYLYDMGMRGNYITVMFLFPRPSQNGLLYTHALDRDTLALTKQQSDELGRGDLTRLDLQYLAVMEDAKAQLKANGKVVDEKVILHGFSASADFATRFSLLHPEVVKGIVVNASPTMPFASYNGVDLKFPCGISDLKALTGITFNEAAYKALPQFWHSGSVDHNDGTYIGDGWGDYGDHKNNWNAEGIDYRKAFGDEITARKRLTSKLLKEKGFTNIMFKEYAGKSHEFTGEMQTDAFKFLDSIK